MDEQLHTPGPWKIEIDGTNSGRWPHIRTTGPYFDDGSERTIAELECIRVVSKGRRWQKTPDADEIEANASLIAAAPELLAACKFVQKYFAMLAEKDKPIATQLTQALESAIAKAEGRA